MSDQDVETNEEDSETRCGFVAIVGRPNVGKSTLLNHMLKQKISITSRKPQTTRHRILGISTENGAQCLFVDTPGLHAPTGKALNRVMNDTVHNVIKDVDVVLFVVERFIWNEADERVLEALKYSEVPVLLIINKIDLVKDKAQLLPHIAELSSKRQFAEIVPVSALGGHNLEPLEGLIRGYLPKSQFLFPDDQVTDRSSRFLASELIREKVTVEIEKFEQIGPTLHIHGLILVDRKGQKRIIVGAEGDRLKQIGTAAREDMEISFECKVMLHLWVKVKSGWADDERALQSLGYSDR